MGYETEFKTRKGHKWETRPDKIHHFSTTKKQKKQGKKTEKNTKKQEKKHEEKKQEIIRNTEMRF